MTSTALLPDCRAVRLLLQGRVQGVGLRPAVINWARACSLQGWITNGMHGVLIHAQGHTNDVDCFQKSIQNKLPSTATVTGFSWFDAELEATDQFVVHVSTFPELLATEVPADVITCEKCLAEVLTSTEVRRQAYPFNSCAQCGPRYSILQAMPFERGQTAMAAYPLCPACNQEFIDPGNRRFHAQTISCRSCGPAMVLTDSRDKTLASSQIALAMCSTELLAGRILAARGLGGYQLICDATNVGSVAVLRQRKGRPTKPLAIMVKDLAMAATLADISSCESALLNPSGPIVLCPARPATILSTQIHPGLKDIGLMLPTTAYHRLLCDSLNKPLVVTSGNHEAEPLAYTRQTAVEELSSLCDRLFHHDREILRPVDDSVVRVIAGRVATIRLARGLAPYALPVKISEPLLAVGGQQKVALAVSNCQQAILGPHLGDLNTIAAQERFVNQVNDLCQLYGSSPEYLVHDQHPDYFTTRWAQQQERVQLAVQHHHAHVVAAMMEHGWLKETTLGIAFDGTGYGDDGTIWGGEFLLSTTSDFQRVAHLRPFSLLGGEQAIRQPHRVTLALLDQVMDRQQIIDLLRQRNGLHHFQPLLPLLAAPHLHPETTSVGRLFDGITALLLSLSHSHYEGEPAMLLESQCDRSAEGSYPLPLVDNQLDWRPLLQAIINDLLKDVDLASIAMRFHRSLAQAIILVIRAYPQYPVVLTGGCFQNRILVELVHELIDDDRRLGLPGVIPCNDGGLAAGQLIIAAARLNCLSL